MDGCQNPDAIDFAGLPAPKLIAELTEPCYIRYSKFELFWAFLGLFRGKRQTNLGLVTIRERILLDNL